MASSASCMTGSFRPPVRNGLLLAGEARIPAHHQDSPVEGRVRSEPVSEITIPGRFWTVISWFLALKSRRIATLARDRLGGWPLLTPRKKERFSNVAVRRPIEFTVYKKGGRIRPCPISDRKGYLLQLLTDPDRVGQFTVMPVALSTTIGGCRMPGSLSARGRLRGVVAAVSETFLGDRWEAGAIPSLDSVQNAD